MDLVIDAGNTALKCFVFDNRNIVVSERFSFEDWFNGKLNIMKQTFDKAIVCNVSKFASEKIKENIQSGYIRIFSRTETIPITIDYDTPNTLGLDRIAAAVGSEFLFPQTNKLIFDFGTAITIDFVDENSTFLGGNISLGMNARIKALHEYTGCLPLVEIPKKSVLTGKNTVSAIQNGVVNGILFEIDEYIRLYEVKYQSVKVIFTGGDCHFFEKRVKNHIFAESNLVAIGLHSILNSHE